jgi:hypothetical protein
MPYINKIIAEERPQYITPKDSFKSFYKKAKVYSKYTLDIEGYSFIEILVSYNTPVLIRLSSTYAKTYYRTYSTGNNLIYSRTTLRHIKAFSGLNKQGLSQVEKLY